MRNKTRKNNNIKRGGSSKKLLFWKNNRETTRSKGLIIGKLAVNTRHSEVDLLDSYEKFTKAKTMYLKRYEEHRLNLKAYDSKLGSGTSFVKFFDELIMPEDILSGDPIDRKNPLLITDYFIYNDSTTKNLKIEHIKQQIRYVYYKNFDKQKERLVKDLGITEISPSTVKINFISKNDKTYTRDCPADQYVLDRNKIIEIISDVSEKIKTNTSEFVSDASKFAAKQKADADAKAAAAAESARVAEEQLRIAQAEAAQRYKPRGDIQQARDFGAAAAAAMAAKPVPGLQPDVGSPLGAGPVLPKLDLSSEPEPIDENLKALLAGKK
jgi:hypothetical protein